MRVFPCNVNREGGFSRVTLEGNEGFPLQRYTGVGVFPCDIRREWGVSLVTLEGNGVIPL